MKLVTFTTKKDSTLRRGVLLGDKVAHISGDFNDFGDEQLAAIEKELAHAPTIALEDAILGNPLPKPNKIICVGLNYLDHVKETNAKVPEIPIIFAKWNNSLAGPNESITLDGASNQVDYEAELAFVIGKKGINIAEADAMEYVAGYVCANDVSARDWQMATSQWVRGKTLDGFCPLGPYIATKDEIPDPHNLRIMCRLNGNTLQDSNTGQLVFKIPFLIEWISRSVTLEPGDVVLTGTPAGVGFTRKPPIFIQPGDVCEIEIEGLGILRNPFV
jgi:acylpyruvate hydrolase